jgi:FkbM family methyltransferase
MLLRLFELILRNRVFRLRNAFTGGFKRRYGFGFRPQFKLTTEQKFLLSLDLTGKTVFDIGAYTGMHTLFFSKAVGDDGRVLAFEPHHINRKELEFNTQLNNVRNVRILPFALGAEKQEVTMSRDSKSPGRARISESGYSVQMYRLDDLDLPSPDFIKIDVEGYEASVLAGMKKIMTVIRPALFIELHNTYQTVKDQLDNYDIKHIDDWHIYCTVNREQ